MAPKLQPLTTFCLTLCNVADRVGVCGLWKEEDNASPHRLTTSLSAKSHCVSRETNCVDPGMKQEIHEIQEKSRSFQACCDQKRGLIYVNHLAQCPFNHLSLSLQTGRKVTFLPLGTKSNVLPRYWKYQ